MKMPRILQAVAAAIILGIIGMLPAQAGSTGNSIADPPPQARIHRLMIIKSLDLAGRTISILTSSGTTHTYSFDAKTQLTLDGHPATFDQIKPPMRVLNYRLRPGQPLWFLVVSSTP